MEEEINFYEGPFYMLSNFSAHKTVYNGVEYITSEHAYQAAKFKDSVAKEKIKNAPSAFLARQYGQQKEGRIEDLENKKVEIMRQVIKAKLSQHDDVKEALLKTGNAVINKNYPDDWFWGTGADGTGKNIIGKIWMEFREELKN